MLVLYALIDIHLLLTVVLCSSLFALMLVLALVLRPKSLSLVLAVMHQVLGLGLEGGPWP